ncbi:MAG: ATP-binding protein [Planctomycetaceae bacterium]|nr:ATP-binding protein [Planctomycetaceae bacterium]
MATILIVDDCPDQLRLASHLLRSQTEHVCLCTMSVAGALERLREASVDLVLTDLQLGDESGLQLIDEIKVSYPSIPVIVMTGVGSEEAAVEAVQHGAASYLPKRLLKPWLLAQASGVLDRSRSAKAGKLLAGARTASTEQFTLTNDRTVLPALIQKLLAGIAEFDLCSEHRRMRVGVALEEALVNALVHGNLEVTSDLRGIDDEAYERTIRERMTQSPYQNRSVRITASLDTHRAAIVIRDEGRGFDVANLPDPTAPENMERAHGRGLLLIRNFFDEVTHNERGNEIRLVLRRERTVTTANSPQFQTLSSATA